ncbi:branched-chain amino acid transport system II carrier protein [Lederbergia graminis]|uniref:Branched-chain amino acid transport system carrier protein n=1 Tax=Lederbergia graminis TaxID=735518 RepID=A0ABW0LK10_9BACI
MQQKMSFSAYAIIGTMLFGMFFGAGNLIFPIHMGQLAGTNFWPALIGFLFTAIGLPFLGVLAFGLSGSNSLRELAARVHPLFGVVFSVALYLTIGPFFAIPRTATVPFVVGFEPYINQSSASLYLGIFSVIFFVIVYFFSLNPAKIMDYIGKYLTPTFLVFLFSLIVIAIIKPMGHFEKPVEPYSSLAFMTGFKEGYNTMDALASLAFGIVVINAIKRQGITRTKEIANATWKAGVFAMVLMMLIYGLITYMGASSVSAIGAFENGGLVFAAVAQYYFGSFGSILLAIIIILACLKTSIGLIIACSEFFHQLLPRVSYKIFVFALCLTSLFVANFGLNNIIEYAVPVLMLLYPLAIVLIILTLFSPLFGHKQSVYAIAIFFAFCVSFFDGYSTLIKSLPTAALPVLDAVKTFYLNYLPLYDIGLGWLLPSIVGTFIGLLWSKSVKNKVV